MNITIIGAGATGSVVAVALARAGEDVTTLLRPDAVAESASVRMQVAASGAEPQWAIIPIVAALAEPPDLVVLCVPAHALADACQAIAHLPTHIPVVALHAAPAGDATAQQALGRRVIGGTLTGSAEYLHIGQARVVDAGVTLDPAITEYPAALAALRGALTVTVAPVVPQRWARLLVDLPQVLAALTNQPLSTLSEERGIAPLILQLLTEATRTLASAGVVPADLPGIDIVRLRKLHTVAGFFAQGALRRESYVFPGARELPISLWQRLRRRRPTEVDALHGAIIRLAQAHAVATPLHTRVVEQMHAATASGAFLSVEALKRALSRG